MLIINPFTLLAYGNSSYSWRHCWFLLISRSFHAPLFRSTVSTLYRVYIPREEVRALILFGNRAQALDPWLSRWLTCWSDKQNAIQDRKIVTIHFPIDKCVCVSRYIKTYEINNLFVRIRNIVNKKMRLCQLMFIGEVELAGDLLEIAYLLVSKSISKQNVGNYLGVDFVFFFRR